MTERRELYVVDEATAESVKDAYQELCDLFNHTIDRMYELVREVIRLQAELAVMEAERDRWRDEARRLAGQMKGERE